MKYKRADRVSALLLRELAAMVKEGLKNPNIGFVTLTAVELSDDLKHARVYVALHGDEGAQERSLKALDKSAPWMRRELARNLELRFVPTLAFHADRSFDHADRIRRLLDRIHEEKEEA